MTLSPTALVWLRLRVAALSESPLMPLVNERLGGPQLMAAVDAPVMPSAPSTFVFSEKNGVARLRDRLKVYRRLLIKWVLMVCVHEALAFMLRPVRVSMKLKRL